MPVDSTVRLQGEVKWFNAQKGYGFIGRDDGGDDVFVHYSALNMNGYKTLKERQRVEFSLVEADKGKGVQAVDVTVVN